jgi:superfamily I DNA/RNA helicase
MTKRSFYIKESELDDYQLKVIKRSTDNSFIVRGCAGSGKSILALWKAHDIISNKKGSVQMIVFTKALKTYMSAAMVEIGIDSSIVDYYRHWTPHRTKYLIVDEAQDFSQAAIDKFLHSADVIIFYGDTNQQLYSWRVDDTPMDMEEIKMYTDFSDEQLVFNHRLPKQIARVVQKINPSNDVLEDRCKNEGAEKPYFLNYTTYHQQLDAIATIIQNRDFEDVGILFSKNNDVDYAANYLTQKGMKVEAKTKNDIDLNWSSTNPKLMTYHSAKGLQFEAVFLPKCELVQPDNNNALYVAMTRTYQSLYILYSEHLTPVLSDVPKDLYEISLANKPTVEL